MVTRFHARDTPDDRTLSIIVVPSCIFSFSLLVNYLRSFHLRLFPPPLLRASPRHDQLLVRTFPDSFPPHPSIDRPNFSLSIFAPRESGRERIAVLSNAIGGERIAFLFRRFPLSLFFRAAFESRYLSSRFIDRPSIGTVEKLARKTLRYRMRDVSRRFRSLKADILLNFKVNRISASRRIRNREIRAVFRFPSCFRRQSRCPIVVDALFPDFYSVLGGRFRGRSWFKVDLVAEKPADRL